MDSGLLFVAFALVALIVAHFGWQAAKKRREEFAAFAASQGWGYSPEDNTWTDTWSGQPFGTGTGRRAQNVLTGTRDGRTIAAFDYSYRTHHTDGQGHTRTQTHRFGVCAVQLPVPLPGLQVVQEGLFGRMANVLGFDDVELESEDFNRTFRVTGDDPKFASDVLHPQLMELLLANSGVAWRIEGDTILSWDNGRHTPGEAMGRLALLDAIVDRVPGFIWRDHGVDPKLANPGAGP